MTTNAEKNYVVAKGMGWVCKLVGTSERGKVFLSDKNSRRFIYNGLCEIEFNDAQAFAVLDKFDLTIARTIKTVTVTSPLDENGNYAEAYGLKEDLKQLILNCAYEYVINGGTMG